MRLLLFLFLTTPLTCLDSENNQPTYKFGIVTGSVDVANATTTLKGVPDEDTCIGKCEEDINCILAFISNSSDCYLFDYGSITAVSKNGTGEPGTVAFKVYTNQPDCDLNIQFLLNGRSYPLNASDTTKDLWRIDTAEDGWTILYPTPPAPLICGNFTYARPYPDGCNPECNTTMVQVNAIPGPLAWDHITKNASSWEECLNYCYEDPYCFVVWYLDDRSIGCRFWKITSMFFLNRTEAKDSQGSHMAIKIPLSQKSCKYTTEELLDDKYYLPFNKIFEALSQSFFRIRTTPKYYKINQYGNEDIQYAKAKAGCELNFLASSIGRSRNDEPVVCVRVVNATNITQAAANELCHEMDGKLMTERFYGFIYDQECMGWYGSMVLTWPNPYGLDWGFRDYMTKPVKMWFGLEKDNNAPGAFKWQAPEWSATKGAIEPICSINKKKVEDTVLDKVVFTWGDGQPDQSPGYDCGYAKVIYNSTFPGYSLHTARCDDVADGFACGNLRSRERGIPPYRQIADEYGVDPSYSVFRQHSIQEPFPATEPPKLG